MAKKKKADPMLTPEEMYQKIRGGPPVDADDLSEEEDDALGEKVCSDAWEGIGCYLGDGVWGDPEYFGLDGEYEFFYDAANPTD